MAEGGLARATRPANAGQDHAAPAKAVPIDVNVAVRSVPTVCTATMRFAPPAPSPSTSDEFRLILDLASL
jgi:hypothetical protein